MTLVFVVSNLSLLVAQDLVKLDVFSILQSGAGVSYEHFWKEKISTELFVRNIKIEDQCIGVFLQPCKQIVSDVGRKWDLLFSMKRKMLARSTKHDFNLGLGLGLTNWYKVSDAYLINYEQFYMKSLELSGYYFFIPLEYNYFFADHLGIGLFVAYYANVILDPPILLNIVYKL